MQLGKCISLGVSSHLLVKHWDVVKSLLREDEGRNLFHLFLDWILLEVRKLSRLYQFGTIFTFANHT
jgi:hypothetical protein